MDLHIRFLQDGMLQGLTPQGVRHIEALHLNRMPLVERRKMRGLLEAIFEREAQLQEQEKQFDLKINRKKRTIRRRRPT